MGKHVGRHGHIHTHIDASPSAASCKTRHEGSSPRRRLCPTKHGANGRSNCVPRRSTPLRAWSCGKPLVRRPLSTCVSVVAAALVDRVTMAIKSPRASLPRESSQSLVVALRQTFLFPTCNDTQKESRTVAHPAHANHARPRFHPWLEFLHSRPFTTQPPPMHFANASLSTGMLEPRSWNRLLPAAFLVWPILPETP